MTRAGRHQRARRRLGAALAYARDVAVLTCALAAVWMFSGWIIMGIGSVPACFDADPFWPLADLGASMSFGELWMHWLPIYVIPLAVVIRACRRPRWFLRFVLGRHERLGTQEPDLAAVAGETTTPARSRAVGNALVAVGALSLLLLAPVGPVLAVPAAVSVLTGALLLRRRVPADEPSEAKPAGHGGS
jgi:hypothetical protein